MNLTAFGIGTFFMEETTELFTKAYQTMDFREADKAIARNSMKELALLQAVKNKKFDVVCWANDSGSVVHAVTRSPREEHDLQCSVLIRGEAYSHQNVDIRKNVHELEFPNGSNLFSVESMNLETERVLATECGIALSSYGWELKREFFDRDRDQGCRESLDVMMDVKEAEAEFGSGGIDTGKRISGFERDGR